MPAYSVLALIPDSPSAGKATARVPSSSDTYSIPRPVSASVGTLTAAGTAFALAYTANGSGQAINGLSITMTDTASASGSYPLSVRVGTTDFFRYRKDGRIIDQYGGYYAFGISGYGAFEAEGGYRVGSGAGGSWGASRLVMPSNARFEWSATTNAVAGTDSALSRIGAGILGVRGAADTNGGVLNLLEVTAPSSPSANQVHLYAEDNGSGKTRIMALFPTGAAQQVAIEP